MEQSRHVSKIVEESLNNYYSYGALTSHRYPLRRAPDYIGHTYVDLPSTIVPDDSDTLVEEHDAELSALMDGLGSDSIVADVRKYWSTPDAEGILSATNLIQSDYGLNDLMQQFKSYIYKDNGRDVTIKRAKITYPHVFNARDHNIPAPHPSMTDDELKRYVWPMSYLNRENRSYIASLWIDIGDTIEEFYDEEDEDGLYGSTTSSESLWRRVMDIPIQVGSNRCNLAIMRSYLDDETYDDMHQMTWGDRARQFLDSMRWEPLLPDGFFIIRGKMKRVCVTDKLMMNISYVVKQSTSAEYGKVRIIPMRERAVEVRSVKNELGLAYMRIILVPPSRSELRPAKGMDNEIFKFYNSTLSVMIDKEFDSPINLFDLVRGYGVAVLGMTDTNQPMNDLLDHIRRFSGNDRETMRMSIVSMAKAGSKDVQSIINDFKSKLVPTSNTSSDDQSNDELISKLRKKVLPHCDTDDLESSYLSKIRFIAMMVVDLSLSVTMKVGTKTYRRDPTDRKDFAYKRWESAGHRLRDHIRSMFIAKVRTTGRGDKRYGNISINDMDNAANQLIHFMNRNQWPSRYKQGGAFKSKKDDYKDGIVDDVPKYNIVAMIDSYRTVKISTKGGPNTGTIRRVHTSQWGQQCPANTPENANIGLNNNMSEVCLISNDLTPIEREALDELINGLEPSDDGDLLILDGNPIGYYPIGTYEQIRDARREGTISRGIGIARHRLWSTELSQGTSIIVIRSSHGRPLIPMFILDNNPYNLTRILSLGGDPDMDMLLKEGYVEFVDAYELVYNVIVAPWIYPVVEHYRDHNTIPYTHAMIKPGHILSQASNCLSYIEHNPPARGTYGTQHIKQAIGRPFLYPEDRYDHETNYLHNPEPPLVITDTMKRILYPKYQPTIGIHDRDVGLGRNVNIACMSFDGNNDDGLVVSQSMVDSGIFDGEHFSITTSDKSILPSSVEAYDWVIDKESNREIKDDRAQGLPDPSFSAGIVVPYGDPYIVEVPDDDIQSLSSITYNGHIAYELVPGEIYIRYGMYSALIIQYKNNKTGIESESIVIPGTAPINIPGHTIISRDKGQIIHRLALVHISKDVYMRSKKGSINRMHRSSPIAYEDLLNIYSSTIFDTRFINSDTGTMNSVPIPKTQLPNMTTHTRVGYPIAIRPRRSVVRGDVVTKIVKRKDDIPDAEVLDPKGERERVEITYGVIDGIERGTPIKIRSSMPIGPKPGNKYAALYAQKSVIAQVKPDDEMPRARWYNPVLGKYEEMIFDIVFNPLSFPSRMTIGMEYEIFIAGTIKYLFNIITPSGKSLGSLYNTDKNQFNKYIQDTYNIDINTIDILRDSTCFIYDNKKKYDLCRDVRNRLGIPDTGLYDLYMRDTSKVVSDDIVRDLPHHREWSRHIESPIACGTVYYVALRHLVDNKRRARGYVGKRDPLTLQPVKGRRRNGGANTGTMETDAYKGHGSSAMLYERLVKVTDYKQFHKCTLCGGLVSKIVTDNTYRCNDCQAQLKTNQIIDHETVNSWHLFRHYVRPLGIEINEHFS